MDNELLTELYMRYYRELYFYLYALCGIRELAEDICQETFCKALLFLDDGHANCRAWLFRVGRNIECAVPLSEQTDRIKIIGNGPVTKEDSLNYLEQLEDGQRYRAYVSLENILEYDEFINFVNSFSGLQKIWCAPCIAEADTGEQKLNIGFYYDAGVGFSMEWDREKYPNLVLWGDNDGYSSEEEYKEIMETEEKAAKHFVTMLNYMKEQEEFLVMLGQSADIYSQSVKYVEENGLRVYGFYCEAYKDTLLELNRKTAVYKILVKETMQAY